MKVIDLNTVTGRCLIKIGMPFSDIGKKPGNDRVIAIMDSKVRKLHGKKLRHLESIDIDGGEQLKTLNAVGVIYSKLLGLNVDRGTTIVGIGGGTVLDITGFVASTFMRGLPFSYVPTTLLAQADAAVGGKNGVNFLGYKNLIGTFSQPREVICDLSTLETLEPRDRRNGLFEIIKHAIIGSNELFTLLEERTDEIMALDRSLMEEILFSSLRVKTKIVARDAREAGLRKKLNLGHTLGHTLEKVFSVSHGDAVGTGIVFAARLSNLLGRLTKGHAMRIERLLSKYGVLPVPEGQRDAVKEALLKDKKRKGAIMQFVLPSGIGRCVVEDIPISRIEEAINDLC